MARHTFQSSLGAEQLLSERPTLSGQQLPAQLQPGRLPAASPFRLCLGSLKASLGFEKLGLGSLQALASIPVKAADLALQLLHKHKESRRGVLGRVIALVSFLCHALLLSLAKQLAWA